MRPQLKLKIWRAFRAADRSPLGLKARQGAFSKSGHRFCVRMRPQPKLKFWRAFRAADRSPLGLKARQRGGAGSSHRFAVPRARARARPAGGPRAHAGRPEDDGAHRRRGGGRGQPGQRSEQAEGEIADTRRAAHDAAPIVCRRRFARRHAAGAAAPKTLAATDRRLRRPGPGQIFRAGDSVIVSTRGPVKLLRKKPVEMRRLSTLPVDNLAAAPRVGGQTAAARTMPRSATCQRPRPGGLSIRWIYSASRRARGSHATSHPATDRVANPAANRTANRDCRKKSRSS